MSTLWKNDDELFAMAKEQLFVALVGDTLDKLGYHHQFLSPHLKPLQNQMVIIGRAMPVLEADFFGDYPEGHASVSNIPFGLMFQALDDLKKNVNNWEDVGEVDNYLLRVLKKEAHDKTGLIYGIGHAVYTVSDPRAGLLKEMARDLAREKGREKEFALMELVEERAIKTFMDFKGEGAKQTCINVDFYSGFVYDAIGLPEEVFTPLFAMARIVGWTAHRIEELNFTSKRIIRPAYKNVRERQSFVPVAER